MMSDETVNPLLVAYDKALSEVTEKFRKDHPEWWFWFTSAKIKPRVKQNAANIKHTGQTEVVKPEPK